jgi:hypothetical protein
MSRVSPYHTTSLEYGPEHRNVYHNDGNCPAGKQIKPEHRASGTADRPLCKDCK